MDLHDEIHLAMATYAARGFPEMPDRALLPHRPNGPAAWFANLTSAEQARMRRAIEDGVSSATPGFGHRL